MTTDRIRFVFRESRLTPAISHILPIITIHVRHNWHLPVIRGLVTIAPLQTEFNWNPTGDNAADNINAGYEIFYP